MLFEDLVSGGVKHETKASATVLAAILTGFLPEVDLFEDVVVEEYVDVLREWVMELEKIDPVPELDLRRPENREFGLFMPNEEVEMAGKQ